MLAGEQPPLFECARQLGGGAGEVRVVTLAIAGSMHACRMMEVVGPRGIDTSSAGIDRLQERTQVAVIFGDEQHRTPAVRSDGRRQLREKVAW